MSASAPSSGVGDVAGLGARPGRVIEIIESSICVATMTGFARRRAMVMARFWTSGTCSSGLHAEVAAGDPIPSNASMMTPRFSTACGFVFASTGRRTPRRP